MNNCMDISIWFYYQHYDKIINQLLNTCIILVRVGRNYSIQGEGGDIFKIQGGVGHWMKLYAYVLKLVGTYCDTYSSR